MTWHGVVIPTADREDWLTKRREGVGASDVAGILELSPYKTPFVVWAEKKDDLPDHDNDAMYWGRALEDVVTDEFERQSGLHVHGRQLLVRHPDWPWAMSTVDGVAFEAYDSYAVSDFDAALGLVEVKTDSSWTAWSDGPPNHYLTQVQWQMLVTGLEQSWIAVLHGGRNFQVYEVPFDGGLAAKIFDRVADWRDRYLVGDEMPDPDGSSATTNAVKGLWDADVDRSIELSAEMAADLDALRGWKLEEKRVAHEVARLENRIKVSLQEATVGTVGGVEMVTWKPVVSRRFDAKALEAERPDLYEKFLKPSEYRTFRVKEVKT